MSDCHCGHIDSCLSIHYYHIRSTNLSISQVVFVRLLLLLLFIVSVFYTRDIQYLEREGEREREVTTLCQRFIINFDWKM